MTRRFWPLFHWFVCLALIAPTAALGADLQPRSVQAYDRHAQETTRAFVARARKLAAAPRCDGVLTARAGDGDGILTVPDALVHHWLGTAYVKGATLRQVVDVARDYPSYPKVYKEVLSSRVLSQQGDDYRVLLRLKEENVKITAVLDVRSAVEYDTLGDGSVSAISRSEEIRQVENAGRPNESLLPVGRDSGYLWRAHTFTLFVPDKDGVFVAMETLGLSRRFPLFLGIVLEPIARRIGRRSVEDSLTQFLAAIRKSAGLPNPKSPCS
jgi:hypothetical protein